MGSKCLCVITVLLFYGFIPKQSVDMSLYGLKFIPSLVLRFAITILNSSPYLLNGDGELNSLAACNPVVCNVVDSMLVCFLSMDYGQRNPFHSIVPLVMVPTGQLSMWASQLYVFLLYLFFFFRSC